MLLEKQVERHPIQYKPINFKIPKKKYNKKHKEKPQTHQNLYKCYLFSTLKEQDN
jgi:hypothetical protein